MSTINDVNYILENKDAIEKKIAYQFKHTKLFIQIFIRKSFSSENPDYEDNEVLEFYGDQLVNTVMTKWLYDSYSTKLDPRTDEFYYSKKNEAELSKIRALYVSKTTLAHCIDLLDLNDFLLLGNSDEKNEVRKNEKVRCDLFEAIIGAIAVDSNWNFEKIENSCKTIWNILNFEEQECEDLDYKIKRILEKATPKNAVQTLNILYLKKLISKPVLETFQKKDENGNQIWRCECFIKEYEDSDGYVQSGIGEENTKAASKQAAAYDMICFIMDKENEFKNNTWSCPYCGAENSREYSVCQFCNELR